MNVFNTSFSYTSEERLEIVDITKRVREAIHKCPVSSGIVLVNSMHTTCALFVNEFQASLVDDLKALADHLVPEHGRYRHNDPRYSDCERGNAHAHLRSMLLGCAVTMGVTDCELELGRFQSIILAEFDGPRRREITVRVMGA
jgi:secondary thiamine-phosphate synthase enzyme